MRQVKRNVLAIILLVVAICGLSLAAYAGAPNGIAGNGTGGIYINVNASPFTDFAARTPNYGAYGPYGCGWFASARACQITGKSSPIWNHNGWWGTGAAAMGYAKGQAAKAPALICWGGHIAVLEKIVGGTAYISEGGYNVNGYAPYGYTKISSCAVSSIPGRNSGFKGYVYLPGATSSGSGVSYSGCKTEWTDTWNAGMYGHINNPNRYRVSYVGAYIWKVNGSTDTLVVNHKEWCGLSYSQFDQRLNVVAEAKRDGLTPGTYKWQFWAQTDVDTVKSAVGTFTIKGATKQNQSITVSAQKKTYGDKPYYLPLKRTGNGKLSYYSSDTRVFTISSTGLITIKGAGTATLKVTAEGNSSYNVFTKITTMTVLPKKPVIQSMKNYAFRKMQVVWQRQSNLTCYQIQFSTNKYFWFASTYRIGPSYNGCNANVKKGVTYYVRIRSVKDNMYSAWSAVKKLKITR